ncbi:formylglycine-generating enzyme family protein [Breznakiellaceae bacterium SP9]
MNKNKSFILGMSAMLLTFGLVLAGCNKGSSGVPLTYPYGIVMAAIPAGTFTMGSPSGEVSRRGDETQHSVTLSAFTMSKHEVTQAQWQAVMGSNPSFFTGDDKRPVEQVSWYETIEFCNRLSVLAGLNPAYTIDKTTPDPNNTNTNTDDPLKWTVTRNPGANGYRLPTEAEWEYACRAETATPFNTGGNITTDQANYDGTSPYNGNTAGVFRNTSTAVGTFAPNAWGLYDMHGNVWEWCWDWHGVYPGGSQTDPMGAASGSSRVWRGGSWYDFAAYLRSAFRSCYTPTLRFNFLGFRVVRP